MTDQDTNKILRDILKWERLQGMEILKKRVETQGLLLDDDEILVYYHTDGSKSSRDIQKVTGVNRSKVQTLWKKWIGAGVAEQTEKYGGGRCKSLFELNELGLENPQTDK